jgi:hypothetical protein
MGFNCAEADNFAKKYWIDIGIKAKFYKCEKVSKQIGMENLYRNLFEKKLIKEKEFEKYLKIIKKDQIKKNL